MDGSPSPRHSITPVTIDADYLIPLHIVDEESVAVAGLAAAEHADTAGHRLIQQHPVAPVPGVKLRGRGRLRKPTPEAKLRGGLMDAPQGEEDAPGGVPEPPESGIQPALEALRE